MRTAAGMSSLLVSPTSGCRSSPSTLSSATFCRYSCARWTGLRVWKPTIVLHPRCALTSLTCAGEGAARVERSEEHTSELQSHLNLVCRLLLAKKKAHSAAVGADRSTCSL